MEGVVSDDTPDAVPADRAGAVRAEERPATFRDVFAVREYRALYVALIASWVADYLARAAITVLVFQQTRSVVLSAASFAISYLPWIVGGPVLAALAERYPYRTVMVICDAARLVLIALVLIPGLPIAAILVLLFLAALAAPPSQAARSAMLPLMLGRDRVVIALTANATTMQAAQVIGYFGGATLAAATNPRIAIGAVAVAYGVSMVLILTGVKARPVARSGGDHSHLLRETAEGFRVVFGNRVLRPIAQIAIALTMFAIVPEGLAAAWAAQGNPDPATRGFDQGLIMASGPVGWIIGGIVFTRFVRPALRQALVRPLAVLAPLALVPALTAPSAEVVALLCLLSGIAQGGLVPTLNGQFVLALPHGYRARAFAVVQGGIQLAQGFGVLVTGLLAEHTEVPTVVGLWSIGGTILMGLLSIGWPSPAALDTAIAGAAANTPKLDDEDTQPLGDGRTYGIATATRVTPEPL
jgi:MFS family permease